jgi:uncharacterized protein
MLKGYQVMDSDGHVIEPFEMWEKYLEPNFKEFAPSKGEDWLAKQTLLDVLGKVKSGWKGNLPSPIKGMEIDGKGIFNKMPEELYAESSLHALKHYSEAVVRKFDAPSQVKIMKKMGIDVSFLYPTIGLFLFAIDTMDPALAVALTRAYNNWLRDFCSYDTQTLRGVGAISLHSPEEMVTEMRRIAGFGWKAVLLRPNPVKGRILSDPLYEPFWTECERLGIAVSIHEGTHCQLPSTGADRFNTRFALHACSHPMEQMMAMLALIEGGVLERHPNLKVGFLEAGCGWLPYWLWRLDSEYKNLAWEVKDNVKMKPSEYFRRQCFISIEPDEPYLQEVIRYIGEDNLIFGSDYPHVDHHPNIMKDVENLQNKLPEKTMKKILWDNASRFYGLTS